MSKLNILFWAADKGGCGIYRCGFPANGLKLRGHNAIARQILGLDDISQFDFIIGQRVAMPSPTFHWNETLKEFPRLMEMDDDLFNVHPTNNTPNFTTGDRGPYERFSDFEIRANLARNLRRCDGIIVTNEHLGQELSRFNKNIFVLPNYIPEGLLEYKRPQNERVTIGWSGSSNHEVDVRPPWIRPISKLLDERSDVDLKIGGLDIRGMLGRPDAELAPWFEDLGDYYGTLTWDIGFIPLADIKFNYSKSYIKALEQAAVGIPVVAAGFNNSPYSTFIKHGETGFLAKDKHEMYKYLKLLIDDEDMRLEMGRNAKELAKLNTVEANAWRYEDVIKGVLG